jgi:hypothetical protein
MIVINMATKILLPKILPNINSKKIQINHSFAGVVGLLMLCAQLYRMLAG